MDLQRALQLVVWLAWIGSVITIITVDQRRRRAVARARANDDRYADEVTSFEDPSLTPFLLSTLFCGALALPLYFYATRKTASGVLLGLTWSAATTGPLVALVLLLPGPLSRAQERARLERLEDRCLAGDWSECTTSADLRFAGVGVAKDVARAVTLLEHGCQAGGINCCAKLVSLPTATVPPAAREAARTEGVKLCAATRGPFCASVQWDAGPTPTTAAELMARDEAILRRARTVSDWPGWPLPAGTKMTPAIFCEGTVGEDLFVHDPGCSPEEVASIEGGPGSVYSRAVTHTCVTRLTEALAAGRVTLDDVAALACIAAHVEVSRSHESFAKVDKQPCADAVLGNVALGGACWQPWECANGLACVGYSTRAQGTCQTPPALGAACGGAKADGVSIVLDMADHPGCADGAWCSMDTCVARQKAGEDCTVDSQCREGLACRLGTCGKPEKRATAGGGCATDRDCGAYLSCQGAPGPSASKTHRTCTARKPAGQPCENSSVCRGVCRATLGDAGKVCVSFCSSG